MNRKEIILLVQSWTVTFHNYLLFLSVTILVLTYCLITIRPSAQFRTCVCCFEPSVQLEQPPEIFRFVGSSASGGGFVRSLPDYFVLVTSVSSEYILLRMISRSCYIVTPLTDATKLLPLHLRNAVVIAQTPQCGDISHPKLSWLRHLLFHDERL